MKKIIVAVATVVLLGAQAFAGSIALDLKILKFDVQGDINAVGMINAFHQADNDYVLSGIQTTIGSIPLKGDVKLDLSIGATTGVEKSGIPFGSVGYSWSVTSSGFLSRLGLDNLKAGIGLGYDFNAADSDWKKHAVGGLVISAELLNL